MAERMMDYVARGTAAPQVIGIVPGEVTGVAVWDVGAQAYVHVGSGTFWEALEVVEAFREARGVGLAVIDAAGGVALPRSFARMRGRERDDLFRRAGRVDRDVRLWVEGLRARELPVRLGCGQAWEAEELRALGGWSLPTDPQGRAAARLVFGATAHHIERGGLS